MASTGARLLEEVRVGIRLKLSALWITMLFLFAYGDIFGFFAPGNIEEIVSGEVSGIEITQGFLLVISIYIAIASAMVFLTLVLSPYATRWTNIVVGVLYVVSIVAAAIGESAYYLFLSAAEIVALIFIIWYAWTWPREGVSAARGLLLKYSPRAADDPHTIAPSCHPTNHRPGTTGSSRGTGPRRDTTPPRRSS